MIHHDEVAIFGIKDVKAAGQSLQAIATAERAVGFREPRAEIVEPYEEVFLILKPVKFNLL